MPVIDGITVAFKWSDPTLFEAVTLRYAAENRKGGKVEKVLHEWILAWDLEEDGRPVRVSREALERLPTPVIINLADALMTWIIRK